MNRLENYPRVIEYLKTNQKAKKDEIAKALDMDKSDVNAVVNDLVSIGFAKHVNENKIQLKRVMT